MSSWKYWCLRLTWNARYTKICNQSSQIVRESRKEGLTKVGREWSGDRKEPRSSFPRPPLVFCPSFHVSDDLGAREDYNQDFWNCKMWISCLCLSYLPAPNGTSSCNIRPSSSSLLTTNYLKKTTKIHATPAVSSVLMTKPLSGLNFIFCLPLHSARGGGIRIYGIELFLKRYFGNLYFNVRYWGTSSPSVCGFLSFWVMVLVKRRSSTLMRYRPFELSCLIQVKTIYNTKHGKLNRLMRVNFLSLWT